jgi:hypothetical protein
MEDYAIGYRLCEIKCNEFWYVIEKYCSSLRGELSIVFKHVMLCRIKYWVVKNQQNKLNIIKMRNYD